MYSGLLEGLKIWGCHCDWLAYSAPLVEIGLTDLPKSGDAMAPQAPLGTTGLLYVNKKANLSFLKAKNVKTKKCTVRNPTISAGSLGQMTH